MARIGKFGVPALTKGLKGCTPKIAEKMISEWNDPDKAWDNIESVYWHRYAPRNELANLLASQTRLLNEAIWVIKELPDAEYDFFVDECESSGEVATHSLYYASMRVLFLYELAQKGEVVWEGDKMKNINDFEEHLRNKHCPAEGNEEE